MPLSSRLLLRHARLYHVQPQREERERRRRERRRAEKENERKGRWEVKGLKRAKEQRCPPSEMSKYGRKRQEFYRIAFQNDNYESAIRSREGEEMRPARKRRSLHCCRLTQTEEQAHIQSETQAAGKKLKKSHIRGG